MDIQSTSHVVNTPVQNTGQAGAAESRVKAEEAQTQLAVNAVEETETAEETTPRQERALDIRV